MEDRYLFRAKRKKWELFPEAQQWVQGYYVHTAESDYIVSPYEHTTLLGEGETVEIEVNTLCRCTGLNDKNGKLIWENDIVDGHIKRGAAFLNCLVLWNESKARFDVRAKGCNFPMTLDEVTGDISVGGLDYEVVGNKFDNPELLEV